MSHTVSVSPVEQVVSGHHAEKACGVSHRVEFVVELLKLLVQQVPCLTLCLTARTTPERESERGRERLRGGERERVIEGERERERNYTVRYACMPTHTPAHTHRHDQPSFTGMVQKEP